MRGITGLVLLVWAINTPSVLFVGAVLILAALAALTWALIQSHREVHAAPSWTRVDPHFGPAPDPRSEYTCSAQGDAPPFRRSKEDLQRSVSQLLQEKKALEQQITGLRGHIEALEAEANGMPGRIREAVISGREEVLRAFGYKRHEFEAMLQVFLKKEQAHTQREQSRREERQRQERQRQEDAARKRREQSQRRSRSSTPWWEVLGVSPNASEEDVRQTYRTLARRFHPDNRATGDVDRMIEINAARDEALQRFAKAA
jgi:hypothetical protein